MRAIKIRDNETGQVFDYGTNRHHALFISEDGSCLTFENLQNGDGSNGGGYSFVLDDGKTPEESDSPDAVNGATYANIGGFGSPDIEKILQEIEREIEEQHKLCEGMEKASGYMVYEMTMKIAKNIIKKHLSENHCSECSRRKFYQMGYRDGKKDNYRGYCMAPASRTYKPPVESAEEKSMREREEFFSGNDFLTKRFMEVK